MWDRKICPKNWVKDFWIHPLVASENQMKSFFAFIQIVWLCGLTGWSVAAQTPVHAKTQEALLAGELAQAATLAESFLQTHPQDAAMMILKARVWLAQGEMKNAFEQLRRALRVAPQNIDALYYLTLTANALAQQEYRQLYALAPDSAPVHLLLAEAALAEDKPAEAESEYQAALKADARSVEALLGLAELKRTQSKCDEALPLYQQAAQLTAINHDLAYGLGACYSAKQESAQALPYFKTAAALAPDAPATRFALGNELLQNGEPAAALPELKAAARLAPNMKQAYFALGRAYQKLGQAAAAKAAFQQLAVLTKAELERDQGKTSPVAPLTKPPASRKK